MEKVYNTVRRKDARKTVVDLKADPSRTVQSDVFSSEIRHILAKYEATGFIAEMRNVDLTYRDVTEFEDYADLNRQTAEARMAFMRLPSKVREVFDHDVGKWLDAANDPQKLEALRPRLEKLGLMQPKASQPLEKRAGPDKGKPRERRVSKAVQEASGTAVSSPKS